MTVVVDVDLALKALEEVVAEKGADHVYRIERLDEDDVGECLYSTNTGNPGCIVGYVAARLTPGTFANLVEAEPVKNAETDDGVEYTYRESAGDAEKVLVSHVAEGESYTEEAVMVLRAAQRAQDAGRDWGHALETARTQAARINN